MQVKEPTAARIATMHNLWFLIDLVKQARQAIEEEVTKLSARRRFKHGRNRNCFFLPKSQRVMDRANASSTLRARPSNY